jgi:mannose-6-phosphate isomerase-like protein (cupin superfamily)
MTGDYRILRGVASAGAGEAHDWGILSLFADADKMGLETMTLGRVAITAGRSNPLHLHPDCTEVLILLEGRLEHVVGAKTVMLEAGDVLAVPAGVAHRAHSVGGADAQMIVAYTSGRRGYVALDEPR